MSNTNEYAQMSKNTVSSKGQMKFGESIFIDNIDGKGKRILFAGNSITLHDIRPSIGWHLACGMAASAPENDYVHILERKFFEKYEDASFCVCQASGWEMSYTTSEDPYSQYEAARNFDADVIIVRLVENCGLSLYDPDKFYNSYKKLISYFNKSGNAKVILTSGFWKHPGDEVIKKVAQDLGYPYVYLGDLGEDDNMKAIGLFEHAGVAAHPGDLGMKNIAERIWQEIEQLI
ncbi:MAG: SGNH/GDSL hydrolase family protein [Clostridia bacterium]|nr:SGNH/GDSL hydrolase family protein [Clostridia bacterium]